MGQIVASGSSYIDRTPEVQFSWRISVWSVPSPDTFGFRTASPVSETPLHTETSGAEERVRHL